MLNLINTAGPGVVRRKVILQKFADSFISLLKRSSPLSVGKKGKNQEVGGVIKANQQQLRGHRDRLNEKTGTSAPRIGAGSKRGDRKRLPSRPLLHRS